MYYHTSVIGCCGLSAINSLNGYPTYESFIKGLKNAVGSDTIAGSQVIATTSNTQRLAERHLKKAGFKEVSKERNSNSGNIVTLWVMSKNDMNKLLKKPIKPVTQVRLLKQKLVRATERFNYWDGQPQSPIRTRYRTWWSVKIASLKGDIRRAS